jgi:uncharacterized protein DUF4260
MAAGHPVDGKERRTVMATLAAAMSSGTTRRASTDGVRGLLRLEGAALLLAAIAVYARCGSSWGLFAALFLAPDLSLLFYVFGTRAGAVAYNAAHSTLAPLSLAFAGIAMAQPSLPIVAIWLAHIGFDRALSYGLKYADAFSHTHLGTFGRKPTSPLWSPVGRSASTCEPGGGR